MRYLPLITVPLMTMPLLALSVPAWAQSPTRYADGCAGDDICFQEEQIVVTGAALPDPVGDAAYSIQKITLDNNASQRLENAIASVAGLQQFRRSDARSANPTSQGITIRGLGGNASSRAVLILDGVPQADPFGGWISWPGYDALRLIEARVRRGGGAGSDGPGALAGAVELFTDSIGAAPRNIISADYGSRNSANARASTVQNVGAGVVTVAGSYARGDGFIPIIAPQRGMADRPAEHRQGGVSVRAAVPIGSVNLQAGVRAFTDERERGFDFSDNQNSGVDASLRVAKSSGAWQWSALAYVQLREFANRFGAVSADRNAVNLTLDQFSVPSTGIGARFELRPPVGDNAELRIGGDWRQTAGNTRENFFFTGTVPGRNRSAGGKTDTAGGYIEASYKITDALTITGSARADHWNITGGFRKEINIGGSIRSDDRFADRSGWESTGRAGFAYSISPVLKLRGAAYQGWRLPTLNELYRPFRVGPDATAANELLTPERLKGADFGLDYDNDDDRFSATIFVNRLEGAIANVTRGTGPGVFPGVGFVAAGGIYRIRQNVEAIDSKGVEIDYFRQFGDFTLHAGYAYVDAKIDGAGPSAALNGLRPAQVPRHFGNVGANYDAGDWQIGAKLRYIGSQFEDDANRARLRDALTADGTASYRISDNIRFELRGENLFDAQVQAAISNAGVIERAAPRTISVGLSLEL
jgi:vitamin B12 transporter